MKKRILYIIFISMLFSSIPQKKAYAINKYKSLTAAGIATTLLSTAALVYAIRKERSTKKMSKLLSLIEKKIWDKEFGLTWAQSDEAKIEAEKLDLMDLLNELKKNTNFEKNLKKSIKRRVRWSFILLMLAFIGYEIYELINNRRIVGTRKIFYAISYGLALACACSHQAKLKSIEKMKHGMFEAIFGDEVWFDSECEWFRSEQAREVAEKLGPEHLELLEKIIMEDINNNKIMLNNSMSTFIEVASLLTLSVGIIATTCGCLCLAGV